jgi:hypothetical protein
MTTHFDQFRNTGPTLRVLGPYFVVVIDTLCAMRFRWDWLHPVVTVPYVPTLGPVAPEVLSSELFDAVHDIAQTNRFLPYDKDRRWWDAKNEHVIVDEIVHQPERTVVPTLTTRGRRLAKIYHYGARPNLDEMTDCGRKLCAMYSAAQYRLVWFGCEGKGARTRVMLKAFGEGDHCDRGPVMTLESCPYASTFQTFTGQLVRDGFAFLYQRMVAGAHRRGRRSARDTGRRPRGSDAATAILRRTPRLPRQGTRPSAVAGRHGMGPSRRSRVQGARSLI